jgi:hypothetical protein
MRVFFTALLLCLSLPARADNWCGNPVESICENGRTDSLRAMSYTRAISDAFASAFSKYSPLRAGLMIQKELSIQASIWENAISEGGFVPEVVAYVLKAIEIEAAEGRLSMKVAAEMKAAVGEIRFFPVSEFYEWLATEPGAERELKQIVEEVGSSGAEPNSKAFSTAAWTAYKLATLCGERGGKDQAFFSEMGGKKTLFLCPGMLLRNVAIAHSDREFYDSLFLVIAHELGHAIDARDFADPFLKLRGCIREHFVNDLFAGFETSDKPPIRIIDEFKISQHMGEISADFWAARAAALYLKEFTSIPLRRKAVQRLWQPFCGRHDSLIPLADNDDGTHPSMPVRFAISMGRAAQTRELLGCAPRTQPGSCGLEGAF